MDPVYDRTTPRPVGDGNGDVVDLAEYLRILRRHVALLLTIVVLIVALATGYTLRLTPTYTSSSEVLVKPISPDPLVQGTVNLDTEKSLVTSDAVASLARTALSTDLSASTLAQHVTAEVPGEADILQISFSDSKPRVARAGATAFARAYLDFRRNQAIQSALDTVSQMRSRLAQLQTRFIDARNKAQTLPRGTESRAAAITERDALKTEISLLQQQIIQVGNQTADPGEIVSFATLPQSPSSPNVPVNIVLALLLGIFVAVVTVFLRDRFEARIRSREDLERIVSAPVVGLIPANRAVGHHPGFAMTADPQGTGAEAFRVLRTGVLAASRQRGVNVVLVGGALPGEGKTTVACNLAGVLAQADLRVLLLSADLRRPTVHQYLGINNRLGLSSILLRDVSVDAAKQRTDLERLDVIASGPQPANPSELLQSERMFTLLEELRNRYDFVVIDSPPLVPVADALELAPHVDGVLLVVDAASAKRNAVVHARIGLEQVGASIVGTILNRYRPKHVGGYAYRYSQTYTTEPEQPEQVSDVAADGTDVDGSEVADAEAAASGSGSQVTRNS
jgi:capsular exopolysaccharide synthesis family protein